MEIEFDSEKSAKNEKERGLPFEQAADLEWNKAFTYADKRRDYGEERFLSLVPMQGRVYVVCCAFRSQVRRIIGFLKANNERHEPMNRPSLTGEDGEVRELTAEDMKLFRPIAEVDPGMVDAMQRMKVKSGRPTIDGKPKVHVGFRMSADVVESIKATGKGYKARVEKVLREALATGKIESRES